MTDLRKAVELADGWRWYDNVLDPPPPLPVMPLDKATGLVLDALAAQLVRQVDALEVYDLWVHDRGVTVWSEQEETPYGPARTFLSQIEGTDRTENTIKAILESGVLE